MNFNKLAIIGLIIWGFSGCGGNPSENKGPLSKSPNAQPVKPPLVQMPPGNIKPMEISPVPLEHPFNPEGKPDPFQPPAEELTGGLKRKGGVLPLEQFEVSDYQLVGIVSGPGVKKAIIQDLTGKGFFVGVGTRIGKGGGNITRITGKEVLVEEPYYDLTGRKKNRKISLKIPDSFL
jgi:Tfp pilus assembly protein PilP